MKSKAVLAGNVVTLHFVDGKRGDDILAEDGKIIDLGGPGFMETGHTPDTESTGGCFISTTNPYDPGYFLWL